MTPEQVAAAFLYNSGLEAVPPVDLEALAGALGVDAIVHRDMDEDGRVEQRAGRIVIYLSSAAPTARQRFTLAHELGHLLMNTPGADLVAHRSRLRDPAKIERYCDQVAASLLMPKPWVRDRAQSPSLTSLIAMAREADVSLTAMFVRACEVSDWKTSLIQFRRSYDGWTLDRRYGSFSRAPLKGHADLSAGLEALASTPPKQRPSRVGLPMLLSGRPSVFDCEVIVHRRNVVAHGRFLAPSAPRAGQTGAAK